MTKEFCDICGVEVTNAKGFPSIEGKSRRQRWHISIRMQYLIGKAQAHSVVCESCVAKIGEAIRPAIDSIFEAAGIASDEEAK